MRVKEKDGVPIVLLMFLHLILQYNKDMRLLVIRKNTDFSVTFSSKGACSFWCNASALTNKPIMALIFAIMVLLDHGRIASAFK